MSIKIVYSEQVNIPLYCFNAIHPFDTTKFGKIYSRLLLIDGIDEKNNVIQGRMCTKEELLLIHTDNYLNSLYDSKTIAMICQVAPLQWIPNFLLQWYLMTPMWYHTGNTIVAAENAIQNKNGGGCICLSGGMHHASSKSGGGWCFFSDISIAIKILKNKGLAKKFMIIDLDYHRGNGYQLDKFQGLLTQKKEDVYIMDVYSKNSYPFYGTEQKSIDTDGAISALDIYKDIKLIDSENYTECSTVDFDKIFSTNFDKFYLEHVNKLLKKSFEEFDPDIIFYNAGSDVLEDDPLGNFTLTVDGLRKRDEMVIQKCVDNKIPFVMTLSGGYGKENYKAVHGSISNIIGKFDNEKSIHK